MLTCVRADVVSARDSGVLLNVAETDVVSCKLTSPQPQRRRHGMPNARPAPPGSSRFLIVRGTKLKEYLIHEAHISMPGAASSHHMQRVFHLKFRESGRMVSEGKDKATETLLDVCKLQVCNIAGRSFRACGAAHAKLQ